MKKLLILLMASLLSLSSLATVELTLKADSVIMWADLESKDSSEFGRVFSLKSTSVNYKGFNQRLFIDSQGVKLDVSSPIDNNIGARIMIVLYNNNKNARLVYYHDKLGNIGAEIEEFKISPDRRNPGESIYVFKDGALEKAFNHIYSKSMSHALQKHIDLKIEESFCAGMEVDSDMVCTFNNLDENYYCTMDAFEYILTTKCP